MKIGITNDHRGVMLKQYLTNYLIKEGYTVVNYGTNTDDSVDYPEYAFALGNAINNSEVDLGIAICGTGIGISIALNKVRGIRCAKVSEEEETILTRKDNDVNAIAIKASTNQELAKKLVNAFINTPFSNESRHLNRINQIKAYENV